MVKKPPMRQIQKTAALFPSQHPFQSPAAVTQIFHNLLIRNTELSSLISSTNITISTDRGHFSRNKRKSSSNNASRCREQTEQTKTRWAAERLENSWLSEAASYQTHAGDAGVVGDVGDVEHLSFVLTAGLRTCEGQRKGLETGGGHKPQSRQHVFSKCQIFISGSGMIPQS